MKFFKIIFYLSLFFSITGTGNTAVITVPEADIVRVDNFDYKLVSTPPDYDGLMWEWNAEKEQYKACICRMTAFRSLQALEQVLPPISDINTGATDITTGWNTDGPEELLVDNMPWIKRDNFHYADSMTPGSDLAITDAWYRYIIDGMGTYMVSSAAGNYDFSHDKKHPGYDSNMDFFDYRTYFKTAPGMDAKKEYFRDVVRGQIVDNFKEETEFNVSSVPVPGAGLLLGSGLFGLMIFRKVKK
jgi:hypothetical protein